MAAGWRSLNAGPETVESVAIGTPHTSLDECRALADALAGRRVAVASIVTAGRAVIEQARKEGTLAWLRDTGVQLLPDLCWCSISEPVFPPGTDRDDKLWQVCPRRARPVLSCGSLWRACGPR